MGLSHSPDEVDHGDCIGRDSMIGPCHVVEHGDLKGRGVWLILGVYNTTYCMTL